MSKIRGIFPLIACLLAAGCASRPPGPPPREWVWEGAAPAPAPRVQPPAPAAPPAIRNSPPAAAAPPAAARTWTSLDRWASEHGLARPRKVSVTPVAAYAVTAASGTLTVTIGSREAAWRGMEVHLGFPPELIDDQVFVHGLDLQKNLAPLLLEAPAAFGSNRVAVIDPGHGGANGGTISVLDGRPEKEFTLDWARRIKPLLEAAGWTVHLTRTNDADIALSNRVAFAAACGADVFISLHFNSAAPDRRRGGLETYCLTPEGMPSTLTRNYADPWGDRHPNNAHDSANLQLAARVHGALLRATGEEDRGIRRARFMGVLLGQNRPAILIEGGFLSNPQEAARIESADFRQKLAEAVAEGLK